MRLSALHGMGTIIMETSPVLFILFASVLNTFLFLVGGSGALRDVEIILPRYVQRGDDVKLICNFDVERDQIYAVNWYKAGQEFYRYVPKEAPPQKAFRPGFPLDPKSSNDHEVFLKNVSLDVSGLYKCSVTAEQTFQTFFSTSEMTVVVIGDGIPSVQLDRVEYHSGDTVTAECQSPFSLPAANITWFYNDTVVGPEHDVKTELRKSIGDPMTQSLISKFSFDLPIPEKLPASSISIKCRVTVFTFYDQNSTTQTILPITPQYAGTETLLRPGTSSSSTTLVVAPDSALLRLALLVLLPSGVTTTFFAFPSCIRENLNWLLCCVIWSLLYPFYYLHHHHYLSVPSW